MRIIVRISVTRGRIESPCGRCSIDDESLADALRRFGTGGVQMQLSFVEARAFAERGQLELVGIVRDEHQSRLDCLAVDRDAERLAVFEQDRPRTDPRERLAPPAMSFATVHESRIEAERDVVEKEALIRAADIDAPVGLGGERT